MPVIWYERTASQRWYVDIRKYTVLYSVDNIVHPNSMSLVLYAYNAFDWFFDFLLFTLSPVNSTYMKTTCLFFKERQFLIFSIVLLNEKKKPCKTNFDKRYSSYFFYSDYFWNTRNILINIYYYDFKHSIHISIG